MKTFTIPHIASLTTAIVGGYPTSVGQFKIKSMLLALSIDFEQFVTSNATFEITLNSILLNLNQSVGLDAFLDALRADARPKVLSAIDLMLSAPLAPQPAGFEELSKELLIIDGHPFVDRDSLSTKILPRLLNPSNPLRAVVMTGPTDSGKTFSLPLVRRLCREAPPPRFRPIAVDLMASALTRDGVGVARTVVNSLKIANFNVPPMDTSEPRIGRRIVDELAIARELSDVPVLPTVLIFDHLDKDVSPSIIDFVEELALAAADGRLQDLRVILIGFPRAPSTTFGPGKLESDDVVQPNPGLLFDYIDRALAVLNRDLDDRALTNLVNDVFAGQQPPYPRPFMVDLPQKIRDKLDDIMKAPTG